jgi:hypothetical protein
MSVLDTLIAERAKIGPVYDTVLLPDGTTQQVDHRPYPTPEQLGALLNAVAWAHRAEGWGLSAKPSGNNIPAPDGTRIAADILHNRTDNVIVDCLIAAGERSEPTWQVLGPMTDPLRPWVAPTAPSETPVDPPPIDPPIPLPQPCVFQPCTHTEVLDVLADLHERLVALETKIDALVAHDPPWVLRGTVDLWGAKRPVVGTVGGQP